MQPKLAKLIIAVMILHCCAAAPKAYNGDILPRPSPINPDIPMDPKPAETITLITDPKEIAKFKREIAAESTTLHITAPTTIPPVHPHPLQQPEQVGDRSESLQHHRQKRDSKTATSVTPQAQQKYTLDNPSKKSNTPLNDKQTAATSSTAAPPKRKRLRPTSTTSTQAPARSTTTVASQLKHRQKRDSKDDAVPLIYRDQHKQPISLLPHEVPPNHAQESKESVESHESQEKSGQHSTIQPQTLPFHFSDTQPVNEQPHKESKRDIPVPLVPKYHHPDETPKDENKHDSKPETHSSTTNKPAEQASTPAQHSSDSSKEKKTAKRTTTANTDVVQVEDLSEHDEPHSTKQHQPQATSSTTGPSIFRHRPVPVAELFAKGKPTEAAEKAQNEAN